MVFVLQKLFLKLQISLFKCLKNGRETDLVQAECSPNTPYSWELMVDPGWQASLLLSQLGRKADAEVISGTKKLNAGSVDNWEFNDYA